MIVEDGAHNTRDPPRSWNAAQAGRSGDPGRPSRNSSNARAARVTVSRQGNGLVPGGSSTGRGAGGGDAAPAGHEAARGVFYRHRVTEVIAPRPVDVQAA